MSEVDVEVEWKSQVKAPVCKTHGHILGRPGLTESALTELWTNFAQQCPESGLEPPATKPKVPTAVVGTPDTSVILAGATSVAESAGMGSCRDCTNYVPEAIVREELGWYLPLCAATGRLLFPHRLTKEPSECAYAKKGAARHTTDGWFILDKRYDEAFTWGDSHVQVGSYEVDVSGNFVEPSTCPTDKPVTDGEKRAGIRAWSNVGTTPRGKDIFLPVFDPEFFDDAEREKIPTTGDDEHPEFYVDHQNLVYDVAFEWMEQDATPALWGHAGVGKTELGRHVAWRMQLPFDRESVTRSTEVDDLLGKWLFRDGETRWVNGRLTNRWEKPGVLLLDEPNVGPDEVWQAIRPLTDNSKQLVLDASEGQTVARHPLCFFMMAMNPSWDPLYVGTNEISDADGNRLTNIFIDLPPMEVERAILLRACEHDGYQPDSRTVDSIMEIAVDLRQMIEDGSLPISWGIRPQIAVMRKTAGYDLEKAYRRAITDRLEPETAKQILGVVGDRVV